MYQWGIKRGGLTEKERKGGKAVWWEGKGKEKRSPKAQCPHLLPRNGINTIKRYEEGLEELQGPQKKEKRESKGPMVPRSSQVNVLQFEQQCVGRRWETRCQQGGRGQEVTGGIQSPGTAFHPAQMLAESESSDKKGEVWGGSNSKAEGGGTRITTAPLPPPNIPCVIAGEYSSRMPH